MSSSSPLSSRREFLSGRALQQQAERAGEVLAEAIVDAGEHRPAPAGHDTVRLETRAMACPWAVVMNPGVAQQVMIASDALDLVHQLEDQLSIYREHSELMQINRRAADSPQPVEAELFALLLQCRQWSEQTDGAFDPTSGPLIRLWRDCRSAGRIPTAQEIEQVRQCVGIHRVAFDQAAQTIGFPRSGFAFDLAAVGKGYSIDRAAAHLRREGLQDFLLHGGHSSLYAAGDHAGHAGWPVGIRNPLFTQERYATLLLKDRGMSTSGSNIQFFRHDGRRYGHILDPRSGWPAHSPETDESRRHAPRDEARQEGDRVVGRQSDAAERAPHHAEGTSVTGSTGFQPVREDAELDARVENPCYLASRRRATSTHTSSGQPPTASQVGGDSADPHDALLSVTVLAESAAQADALSTAFYVMGLEKARDYCHNHPLVSAILIPAPTGGRALSPVVCNLPEEQLFFEASGVRDA